MKNSNKDNSNECILSFKNKRCLIANDFENTEISYWKKYQKRLNLDLIDKWIHDNYNPFNKIAFLNSGRINGYRDGLVTNGWTLRNIITKYYNNQEQREVIIKNSVDNELALTVYELKDKFDILVLFAGDIDYLPLVKRLKMEEKELHIVAVKGSLSNGLSKFADMLIMIEDIISIIENERVILTNKYLENDNNSKAKLTNEIKEKIRNDVIKEMNIEGGNIPSAQGINIIFELTGAKSLKELGVDSTKELFKLYPDTFYDIIIENDHWKQKGEVY